MRRPLVLIALLTAILAGALAGQAAAACSYSATLRTPGHHPKAGKPWPVRITLSRGGLSTHVRYDFYFKGRKVATRYPFYNKRYRFRGTRFIDRTFTWPKRSIGIPLVVKFVLSNRCGTKTLAYSVRVVR